MASSVDSGRTYVAVIGIDKYRTWPPLHNAVQDARGALDAFAKLGFEPFETPLLDEAATGDALHHLVTDELRRLGRSDSLVLFFAGHGHTLAPAFSESKGARRGYLIPADADGLDGSIGTWLKLESWLSDITHLPPRHILVILDACHSGIALDPATRWRSDAAQLAAPMDRLRARRSRRVLTSALDDELAMDGGPIAGHSLFTGCLIEALGGELFAKLQRPIAAASELWSHVRHRVFAFSSQKNWKQTPEFGRLDFDDHGELIVQLPDRGEPAAKPRVRTNAARARVSSGRKIKRTTAAGAQPRRIGSGPLRERSITATPPPPHKQAHAQANPPTPPAQANLGPRSGDVAESTIAPGIEPSPHSPPGATKPSTVAPPDDSAAPEPGRWQLDEAFVAALDRHDAERMRGASVLSIVRGDATMALTGWAAWAARRGYLTLITESATLDAAIGDLLAQAPWLRSLRSARMRLAEAADLSPDEVDAALDARSEGERTTWIDDVAGIDRHARVSGWLLSALRQPRARVPDLTTAPVPGGELLSILCDLAAPIAVLLHHAQPQAPWLEAAIRTAAALVACMPRHSVAVGAPSELVTEVLRGRDSAALSMARQGVVPIARATPPPVGRARSRAERALHDALARDPRTAGHFALNVPVPVGDHRAVEVDLVAAAARLAVEIDGWYHFREPQGYRRDRAKDVLLQRAGFFVMRFLAEDVEDRLILIVDEIATGLAGRRSALPLAGDHQ